MIRLKSIFRIMLANKRLHLINIAGLSIGLTVVILIGLYVRTEMMFDKHIENHTNKYRLLQQYEDNKQSIFPYVAGELIKNNMPELQSLCMISGDNDQVSVDKNNYAIDNIYASDPDFIKVFDVQIVEGNSNGLLNAPNTCMISENTSRTLFGNHSPIGKTILFSGQYERTVEAVYKDFPNTSHIKVNIVFSRSSWRSIPYKERYFTSWGHQGTNIYVALNPESNVGQLQQKITNVVLKNSPWYDPSALPDDKFKIDLQPMSKIHLHSSDIQWDSGIVKNNISTIKAFVLVMALVLLLACFNYINLSTASSESKNKIAGIQKSLGAKKGQIILFFFTQTFVTGIISTILALFFSYLTLPYFNQLMDAHLRFSLLYEPILFACLLSTIFMVIFLSGIYPALSYSSGSLIGFRKNIVNSNPVVRKFSLRSVLVSLQFAASIFLMISLLTIRKQIKLLTTEELGFNKEQLIEIQHYKDSSSYEYLANEFKKFPLIKDVTAASNMPCEYINNENGLTVVGKDMENNPTGCLVGIEPNYLQLMNTRLLAGRDFDSKLKSDEDKVLINETAVRLLGLTKPIGEKLKLMGSEYEVIGVVEDVQYRTLHEPSHPVLYSANFRNYKKIAVKLNPGNHLEAINQIKTVWSDKYPDEVIDVNFFDSKLDANYKTEIKHLRLFNILVIIGVFIMILGLLGLIWFIVEKKTKEIGIRKVNGASIKEILKMLNKDFVKWVIIAFVIATPIAYYAMNKWLENFAYKTTLSWWIFALAGLSALVIALLTVSWQSWRAANRNPVEALRYE